ncbi:BQ2448_326 [Microbotryum intermedium]|uniref:BQ2448_326 protein n=1 Tax=Microbotryum intermedium TaxID=269621 RepID=A0A238F576_9BASI|nr:BQ2448_326 [Microbotryum intermedium]
MSSDGPYLSPTATVTGPPSLPSHRQRHGLTQASTYHPYHPSPIGASLSRPSRPSRSSPAYPQTLRPSLLIPRPTTLAPTRSTTSLDVRPIHAHAIQASLFTPVGRPLGARTNPFELLNEHKFDSFVENVTERIKSVLRGPEPQVGVVARDATTTTTSTTAGQRDHDVFGMVEPIHHNRGLSNDDLVQSKQDEADHDDDHHHGALSPPRKQRPLFQPETTEEYDSSYEAAPHSFAPSIDEQDEEDQDGPRQNGNQTEVLELGSSSDEDTERDDPHEDEEEEPEGSYEGESIDEAGSEQVADEWMHEAPRPSQLERNTGSDGSSRPYRRMREVDIEEDEDAEEDEDEDEVEDNLDEDEDHLDEDDVDEDDVDEDDVDEDDVDEDDVDEDDVDEDDEQGRDELREDEMDEDGADEDEEEELLDPQAAFARSLEKSASVDADGDELELLGELVEDEYEVDAVDDDGGRFEPVDDEEAEEDEDEEGTPPRPPAMALAEGFKNARSGEVWDSLIKGPSLLVREPEYDDDDAEDDEILGSRIPAHLKGKGRAPTPSTQSPASVGSAFDSEGNGSLEPEDDDELESLVNFQVDDLPDMPFDRLTKLMETLHEMHQSACRQHDDETVAWVEDKWEVVKEAWMAKGGELSSDEESECGDGEGEDDDDDDRVDGGHFDEEQEDSDEVEDEDDGGRTKSRIEHLAEEMLERYAKGQDREVRVDSTIESQRILQEVMGDEGLEQEQSGLAAYQDESGLEEDETQGADEVIEAEQTEDHNMTFTGHHYRPPTPDEDDAVVERSTTFDDEPVMGVPTTLGVTETTETSWLAILQDQIQAQAAADAATDGEVGLGFAPPRSAEAGDAITDDRMEEDGDDELEEEEEDNDVQILSPVDLTSSSPTPSRDEQDEDAPAQEPPTPPREEAAPSIEEEAPATPYSEPSADLSHNAQASVLDEESTGIGMTEAPEAPNDAAPAESIQDKNSTPAPPQIHNVLELGESDPCSPIRFDTSVPAPSAKPSKVVSSLDAHSETQNLDSYQASQAGMDEALRAALALPAATMEEQFGGAPELTSTLDALPVDPASPKAEPSNDASQQHFSGLGNIWAQIGVKSHTVPTETKLSAQPASPVEASQQEETTPVPSADTQLASAQTTASDATLVAIDVTMPPSSASLDALLDYVEASGVVPTSLDILPDVTPELTLQAADQARTDAGSEAGPSTTVEVSPSTPEAGPSTSAPIVRATPPSIVTINALQGPTGLLTPDPDGYDRVPSLEDDEIEIEEPAQPQDDPFTDAPSVDGEPAEAEAPLELQHDVDNASSTARESSIIDEHDLAFFKARHHSEHLVNVDDDESIPTMSANVSVISDEDEVEEAVVDAESIDIDRAFEEIVASSPPKQSLLSDLDLDIGYRMQEDEFASQDPLRSAEEATPSSPTLEVMSTSTASWMPVKDEASLEDPPPDQSAVAHDSPDEEPDVPAPDDAAELGSPSIDVADEITVEEPADAEELLDDVPDAVDAEMLFDQPLETEKLIRSTTPDYEPFTTTPEAEPFEFDEEENVSEMPQHQEGESDLLAESHIDEAGPELANDHDHGHNQDHDFDLDAPLPTVEDPWTPEVDDAASSSDSEADEAVQEMLLSEADHAQPEEVDDADRSVAATEDDAESVHVHFESPVVAQHEDADAVEASSSHDEPAQGAMESEIAEIDEEAAVELTPVSPKPPAETEEEVATTTKRRRSSRSKSPVKRARTSTPEREVTQSPRRISARLHPEALLPPNDISVPPSDVPRLVTPEPSDERAAESTPRRSERNLRRSASVVTLRDPSPNSVVESSAASDNDPSTPPAIRRSIRHAMPGSTATSKKRTRSDAEPEESEVVASASVQNSPTDGPKRRRGTPAPASVAVEAPGTSTNPTAPRLHHHSSSSDPQEQSESTVDHPTTRAHCPFVQLELQSRDYPSAPPVVVNLPSCALSTSLAQETLRTFPIRQLDQIPHDQVVEESPSIIRLGGTGPWTLIDGVESGSTHISIEERDAEMIPYPDVLDALKKVAGGEMWHEGLVELVRGGGRRSTRRGRSKSVPPPIEAWAGMGEVVESGDVPSGLGLSDREEGGRSKGSGSGTTRSLRRRN